MKVKKAIIPAAGLGTRFLPATKAQPKEMLPIVDIPTIQVLASGSDLNLGTVPFRAIVFMTYLLLYLFSGNFMLFSSQYLCSWSIVITSHFARSSTPTLPGNL